MKEFWRMGKEEVLKELGVSQQGLAGKDVESRKEKYGENILEEAHKKSILRFVSSHIGSCSYYFSCFRKR